MKIQITTTLTNEQKQAIVRLWNTEYPVKLAYNSIEEFDIYLNGLENPSHILISNSAGDIIGWFVHFIREQVPWFAMIIDSKEQGKGYGTKLLSMAKENLDELNGWAADHNNDRKKDGTVYLSPIEFYRKNGFQVVASVRFENDKLSAVKVRWEKVH